MSLADKVVYTVVVITLVLAGIHAALELTWRFRHAVPNSMRPVLMLNKEESIATWLSVFQMGLLGLAAVTAGVRTGVRTWYVVGAFFLFLSMDDATMLHERIGWLVAGQIGESDQVYRWIQFMGPVLALAGFAAFGFLFRQFAGSPKSQVRLFLAFAFLGSSLVFELFERYWHNSAARLRGFPIDKYTMLVEESFELVAPALLLACLISFHEKLPTHPTSDLP